MNCPFNILIGRRRWRKLLGIWSPRCRFAVWYTIHCVKAIAAFAASQSYRFQVSASFHLTLKGCFVFSNLLKMIIWNRMFWVSWHSKLISMQTLTRCLPQIALYVFPVLWTVLFLVSIFKFNISYPRVLSVLPLPSWHVFRFLPIVAIAIVFNYSNAIGFTYAWDRWISYLSSMSFWVELTFRDQDAKRRWANSATSGLFSFGGLGGQLLGGMVKNSVSRVFGWKTQRREEVAILQFLILYLVYIFNHS